jgi:UDP-N-acetyl-D-mannosaminuronic acid dehydrogenase
LVSASDALQQADVLVMLVDHHEFKGIHPAQIVDHWIVDTKGVWR